MQALLLSLWKAMEPQVAGMVRLYHENHLIPNSLRNSSAINNSGWIQRKLDNTTAPVRLLMTKLSHTHKQLTKLLEKSGRSNYCKMSPEQFSHAVINE